MLVSERSGSHWCPRNSGLCLIILKFGSKILYTFMGRVTEQKYRWSIHFPKYFISLLLNTCKSIEKNNVWGCGIYGDAAASTSLSFPHDYSVILWQGAKLAVLLLNSRCHPFWKIFTPSEHLPSCFLLLPLTWTHLNMTVADAGFLGLPCHDLLNGFPADIPSGKEWLQVLPKGMVCFAMFCHAAWLWKMWKAIAKINVPNRWFFTFLSFRLYIVSNWGVWDFGFVWVFFCLFGWPFFFCLLLLSVLLCHRTGDYLLQRKKKKISIGIQCI